ncbi:MAG: ribosome biogenesis GTPase Der [Christensenellales bacterium]|jgi:GTP-binding protein
MAKPLVAIIGRPNVGKSTFFNRMAGRRIAIVEDYPGVTRDRLYADVEWLNHQFTLIDTGGIEMSSDDELWSMMRMQAQLAVETADVILFFVDGRAGLVKSDEDVAEYLRKSSKPVVVAVNKIDTPDNPDTFYDFYSLGMGDLYPISAEQGLGLGDLLDAVAAHFPPPNELDADSSSISIAVVGKPNAGKSSLVNALLKKERSIVSDIPGTTRDAIDTPFEWEGGNYVIIDTAGMRKQSKIAFDSLEKFSVLRALTAIRRCDVAVIVTDAEAGITEQDQRIAGFVKDEGKAAIILANKWDTIEKDTYTIEKYRKDIYSRLEFISYAPILFISAKTGQRVDKVMGMVKEVYKNATTRITTGTLNECINEAVVVTEPPSSSGRRLKIYYATQVSTQPPTFALFVNDKELMHYSYERYIENYLRKTFNFEGTPIRLLMRERKD